MRIKMIFTIMALVIGFLNAQELVWQKTYGGSEDEEARAVQVLEDGSIIIAGWTKSFGNGGKDVYLVKVDKDGKLLWQKTYGGSNDDVANDMQVLDDGSIILAGWTKSFGAVKKDVYILKVDRDGNKIWERTFKGGKNEVAEAIGVAENNSIVVAGWVKFSFFTTGIYLLKIDANGNEVWQKIFKKKAKEQGAYALKVLHDGGILLAGEALYITLWKFDGDGNLLKENRLERNALGSWYGYDLYVFEDGGGIIAGTYEPNGAFVVRFDNQLDSIWTNYYIGGVYKYVSSSSRSLQVLEDTTIIIAGNQWKYAYGESKNVFLAELDKDGNIIWERTYGGKKDEEAYSLRITDDGTMVVAGWTKSYGLGGKDVYLLKFRLRFNREFIFIKQNNAPLFSSTGRVLTKLPAGTKLKLLLEKEDKYYVKVIPTLKGWIDKNTSLLKNPM